MANREAVRECVGAGVDIALKTTRPTFGYRFRMAIRPRAYHEAARPFAKPELPTPIVWLAALLVACGNPSPDVALADLHGQVHAPQAVVDGEVHVVVFLSHECPIANAYAPTLASLAKHWSGRPVRVFLVHIDPELPVAAARKHREDYKLPGTILMDPAHKLATVLGATRTPEAVVLNHGGVVYRGRIDNQWPELGVRTPKATKHDLREAVEVALRGSNVPGPHPPAVGCLLPEPAR